MVTLETLQLVVTWQHCWRGNDVEALNLCMDFGQTYIWRSQLCTTAKNDTGVSLRYSYKLFLYLLFYIPEMTNLTMLFNVLLTTLLSFFMTWSCLKQSIPSYIFLLSNKIFSIPQFENCVARLLILDLVTFVSHLYLRTGMDRKHGL